MGWASSNPWKALRGKDGGPSGKMAFCLQIYVSYYLHTHPEMALRNSWAKLLSIAQIKKDAFFSGENCRLWQLFHILTLSPLSADPRPSDTAVSPNLWVVPDWNNMMSPCGAHNIISPKKALYIKILVQVNQWKIPPKHCGKIHWLPTESILSFFRENISGAGQVASQPCCISQLFLKLDVAMELSGHQWEGMRGADL